MTKKPTDTVDTCQGWIFGCNPEPDAHEAFIGFRCIWDHRTRRLDYVPGRNSAKGQRRTLDRLLKWWNKRGGMESRWYQIRAGLEEGAVWKSTDPKTGNTCHVRKGGDYVYISLYHDVPEEA